MKYNLISILLCIGFFANAQLEFGAKTGLHSYTLNLIDNQPLSHSIQEASYGIHLGADFKFELAGITFIPSLILNKVNAKYSVNDPDISDFSVNQLNMEVPVMLGYQIFMFNVFAGPVAHFRVSGYDEVIALAENESWKSALFGGQIGGRISLLKWYVDLRYEKNFYSSDPIINAQRLALVDSYSRVILSVGRNFIKK